MMLKARALRSIGPVVLGLMLTGCDKLTRSRFDMIQQGVADAEDVERTIGAPDHRLPGEWQYERIDKHLNVQIDFDEKGTVSRKQWTDVLHGEIFDSAPPPRDQNVHESTRIRKIDD